MKQVSYVISTYTSDVSGVCSALYELGGMVVIHDPSGCNSTYNTHDEPRWFDHDSYIFISGLSQMDAVLGKDDKFVADIIRAAEELHPRFIALVRSPIPLMIGTDFEGISREVELATGIPTFFVPTTGMKSYISGAGEALRQVVIRLMDSGVDQDTKTAMKKDPTGYSVNLLGATPLDFSINDSYSHLKKMLEENGFTIQGSLALNTDFEEMCSMRFTDVNLVVSSTGYPAALAMKEKYGIPYVVGFPCGSFGKNVMEDLRKAASEKTDIISYLRMDWNTNSDHHMDTDLSIDRNQNTGVLVYEPVMAQCLAVEYSRKSGRKIRPVTMLSIPEELCRDDLIQTESEEEITKVFQNADFVYADPMFQPICPKNVRFYALPHEAFSGRIYRRTIPDLIN